MPSHAAAFLAFAVLLGVAGGLVAVLSPSRTTLTHRAMLHHGHPITFPVCERETLSGVSAFFPRGDGQDCAGRP